MRHFWALPAVLRVSLVLAAQRAFNVNDDLLAYPQFKVQWLEEYVSDTFAEARLHAKRSPTAHAADDTASHLDRYEPPPISGTGRQSTESSERAGEDEKNYELMVLHKQRFLCTIPRVAPEQDNPSNTMNDTTLAQQRAEEAKELARANARGWELLNGMQGNCVYYISGWWSYRFCFQQGVKQFHALAPSRGMPIYPPQEDPGVDGFVLGKYEGGEKNSKESGVTKRSGHTAVGAQDSPPGQLVTKGESKYLVQKLEGGTICDLTGKGRRIEIQFHCNPSMGVDRISLIKELSTCSYLMVIQTPRLCNDVAFLPPQQDVPNDIVCQPILKPEEVEGYLEDLATIKEALRQSNEWTETSDAREALQLDDSPNVLVDSSTQIKVVGDVIVGGHSIIPRDMELEKSAIVGGGKMTYLATVASSEGIKVSRADMERLGYGDPRIVDRLMKEMEEKAEGLPWKLDLFDTPRGREYRGYIDGEADEKLAKAPKEKEEEVAEPAEEQNDGEQDGSQEEYFIKQEL